MTYIDPDDHPNGHSDIMATAEFAAETFVFGDGEWFRLSQAGCVFDKHSERKLIGEPI